MITCQADDWDCIKAWGIQSLVGLTILTLGFLVFLWFERRRK